MADEAAFEVGVGGYRDPNRRAAEDTSEEEITEERKSYDSDEGEDEVSFMNGVHRIFNLQFTIFNQ